MPSYKTNDPKGWCGDPKRGAALGRPTIKEAPANFNGKLTLRAKRVSQSGYDENGTYWGRDIPLYWVANENGTIDYCLRAHNRRDAKARVRKTYPNARFHN